MDIGTLFQARNFLNSKSVPASPMKNINACEDLILKYSDALLLSAFDDYIKSNNIDVKSTGDDEKDKMLMEKILNGIVDNYVIPEVRNAPLF